MDAARIRKRLARVREAMRDKGLHALLVYESGRHNFLRMNYVAYLTDFISVGPETMLVVPLEDQPVLYLAPAWDIPRAQEESWVLGCAPVQGILVARRQSCRQGRIDRPGGDARRSAR